MAEFTKAGFLTHETTGVKCNAVSVTGRYLANLPHLPSVTLLFVTFSTTGSLTIGIKDGKSTTWIPIRTITATSLIKIALPASAISVNITAIGGTATVQYRAVEVNQIPNIAIEVFTAGTIEPSAVTTTGTVTSTVVDVQKRLYGPAQPAGTSTLLYTVPTAKKTTLEYIHAINTAGTTQTVTIAIGASITNALSLLSAYSIPANGILTLPCEISMVAAETILGLQSSATAITVTLNGTETSA